MMYRDRSGACDDGSGCAGLASAWLVSSATTPGEAPASARAAAAPPPAAGALRARSTLPGRGDIPFLRLGLTADRGQPGVRQHRQGDVAVPARPVADLILVQPGLPLASSRHCSTVYRVAATVAKCWS